VCRICLWQGVLFRGATFGIWQWIGHSESSHYQYKVQPCHSEPKFRTQIGNGWEKPRLVLILYGQQIISVICIGSLNGQILAQDCKQLQSRVLKKS